MFLVDLYRNSAGCSGILALIGKLLPPSHHWSSFAMVLISATSKFPLKARCPPMRHITFTAIGRAVTNLPSVVYASTANSCLYDRRVSCLTHRLQMSGPRLSVRSPPADGNVAPTRMAFCRHQTWDRLFPVDSFRIVTVLPRCTGFHLGTRSPSVMIHAFRAWCRMLTPLTTISPRVVQASFQWYPGPQLPFYNLLTILFATWPWKHGSDRLCSAALFQRNLGSIQSGNITRFSMLTGNLYENIRAGNTEFETTKSRTCSSR